MRFELVGPSSARDSEMKRKREKRGRFLILSFSLPILFQSLDIYRVRQKESQTDRKRQRQNGGGRPQRPGDASGARALSTLFSSDG